MPSPTPVPATRCLSEHDLPTPVTARWFEDYEPGASYEFGTVSVTEDAILGFAATYDPQPIHLDPVYAATGPFGGLIASGVQTVALLMRVYVDHYVSRVASLASPGLDELRWPAPVRPGDELRLRLTVAEARLSRSRPDRGLVHTRAVGVNRDDITVLSFTALNFFLRRPAG